MLRLLGKHKSPTRIRYSDHVVGDGSAMLEHACRMGLEGVISKRRDLPYQPGRTKTWLKTKCIARQEFVIGGFTDPEGSRQGIGALLIGFYDKNRKLIFAGRVGTGFTQKAARELRKRLDRLEQQICPFATRRRAIGRNAHWVQPELVAEVAFSEWTGEGRIRHPSFQGLREAKRPKDMHWKNRRCGVLDDLCCSEAENVYGECSSRSGHSVLQPRHNGRHSFQAVARPKEFFESDFWKESKPKPETVYLVTLVGDERSFRVASQAVENWRVSRGPA